MPDQRSRVPDAATRPAMRLSQELILTLLLVAEAGLFAAIGKNFLTAANGFEIVRLAVEIGLLASR